ncbi:FAD/NAD(P)-binding protein [Alphaproteobacteria bacterium LSUCC0684]
MTEPIPILIIGDGYAGAVLTLHLLERGIDTSRMAILGPDRLGAGKAYGCRNPDFRLNVRDDLMMLRPGDSQHFATWAEHNLKDPDAETSAGRFFRRQDFARYLEQEIHDALGGRELLQIRDRAHDLKPITGKKETCWHITTTERRNLAAETVVLALGNPDPSPTFPLSDGARKHLIPNAWTGTWVEQVDKDADMTVIGGGLTAMDAILTLEQRGHRGQINIISPIGMLPPRQTAWIRKAPYPWPRHLSGREFLAIFRRQLGDGDWKDPDWQARFESLRPGISFAWQNLPETDRQRLKQEMGWWWQLIRYRASPQTVAAAARLEASGQLKLYHGRCEAARTGENDKARITISLADETTHEVDTDHLLLATGAGKDPLAASMFQNGLLAGSPAGLKVDHGLNVLGADGLPLGRCHAIGPPTAFALGDVIGASSIGRQAFDLARHLAGDR